MNYTYRIRVAESSNQAMWITQIEAWRSWLRLTCSPATLRLRTIYIRQLADLHPDPWEVTLDDLVEFIANPAWKPETQRAARAAVRSFYRWALITDRVDKDKALHLPRVAVPPAYARPTPEAILLAALEHSPADTKLMLLLGAYGGLRRSEISRVHSDDLADTGLRITGKGGRLRVVPLHLRITSALPVDWSGWLFPSRKRPGHHVSADCVYQRVTAVLAEWTTHTLRHRFATRAYAGTKDLRAVQTLLGHASPMTTSRYVAVANDDLAAAVAAVA